MKKRLQQWWCKHLPDTPLTVTYLHQPGENVPVRVTLHTKEGNLMFDGTLWLFNRCADKGYFL